MNYLNKEIIIIGLGYVGLPLAVNLSSAFDVVGFDISIKRISELKNLNDSTKEISSSKLKNAKLLKITSQIEDIQNKYIYIL